MTRELLTRLPLWNDPTPAANAAVAALLDELAADHGHVLHGDIGAGRGRHVMISSRGVDVVRVVSMAGPITAGPITAGPITAGPITAGPITAGPTVDGIGLLSGGVDVTEVLAWIDDLTEAMRESLAGVGSGGDPATADATTVRGWLCVLDAAWSGGTDDLVVHGQRVVRYGALAHALSIR